MSFDAKVFDLGDTFAQGAFGDSYMGRQRGKDATLCAIKHLNAMAIDRRHVSEMTSRLAHLEGHAGIVPVIGKELESSPYWIASEFQGTESEPAQTVASLFGSFADEEEAFDLLFELAETLGDLHGEGILHGNLHPGNVFLSPEGAERRCRIADFGQALIGTAHHVPLTTDSLRTLAPEQLLHPEDFHSENAFRWDVYAFGVLAFRILTGKWPRGQRYVDAYRSACEDHHGGNLPLDVQSFIDSMSDEEEIPWFTAPATDPIRKIREVIEDCLSLRPEKRPRTGGDIQIRLAQIAHDIELARTERQFASERRILKRKLWLTRTAAVLLISLLTLATHYGITTLRRALDAEETVEERNAHVKTLSSSVAETNSAYGSTLDQLWRSREAADRFFNRLSRQDPLSKAPLNPVETEGRWLGLARDYYGKALETVGASWNSDLEAARGHHNLAHAALAFGDTSVAEEHFRESIGVLEPLIEAENGESDRAELFTRLGDCHRQLWIMQPIAWTQRSLAHLDHSAEAFQRALESRPDDPVLVLNASAACFYLGLHQGDCQLLKPALVSYSRCLELLALLEKLRPAQQADRFLAARAYNASGAILKEVNRKPAALDAQVSALGILLDLTSESPQKTEFDVELARCYCELGDLFQSVQDVEAAPDGDPDQMFNESNRILLSVLTKSPKHPHASVTLAQTYMGLSKLNLGRKRTTEAVRLAQQAVNLLTELVAQHPENIHLPFQLAHHKVEYMRLLAAVAKSKDAIKFGVEASATLENLLREHENLVVEPVIKNYQRALADLYEQLGTLTENVSENELAAEHYTRAIGYWELLASNYGTEEKEFGQRLAASRDMLKRVSP